MNNWVRNKLHLNQIIQNVLELKNSFYHTAHSSMRKGLRRLAESPPRSIDIVQRFTTMDISNSAKYHLHLSCHRTGILPKMRQAIKVLHLWASNLSSHWLTLSFLNTLFCTLSWSLMCQNQSFLQTHKVTTVSNTFTTGESG